MSEIFDNYARIAREQGLVSEAADLSKEEISEIENLYHLKPNGDEDILDLAHPESVIIAPSYDRLNGLVENLKERQNIMIGIVNKRPQAKHTGHRYASAHSELITELVRIGFSMDNQNQDDLRILADSCADRLDKDELKKEAIGPLAIGIAFSAAYGLLGVYNSFTLSNGLRADAQEVQEKLEDLLENNHPTLSGPVSKMLKNVNYVVSLAEKIAQKQSSAPSATINSAVKIADTPEYKAMDALLKMYENACNMLAEQIPGYIKLLKAVESKTNTETESSVIKAVTWIMSKVWVEDLPDALMALDNLKSSLNKSTSEIAQIREQYEAYVEANKGDIAKDIQAGVERGETAAAPKQEADKSTIDSAVDDLEQALSGTK